MKNKPKIFILRSERVVNQIIICCSHLSVLFSNVNRIVCFFSLRRLVNMDSVLSNTCVHSVHLNGYHIKSFLCSDLRAVITQEAINTVTMTMEVTRDHLPSLNPSVN